jgi:hypothetical protein
MRWALTGAVILLGIAILALLAVALREAIGGNDDE